MAVISKRTGRFRELLLLLPAHVQALAVKSFRLWMANPAHPSVNFEDVGGGRCSARVGRHHRALGKRLEGGIVVWTWIGSHEAYNRLLRERRG